MPPKAKPKSKTKISKKPIPEDFELSSDEEQPKTITLTKEQRLMSKNIVINCPLCDGRIQLRNEIEINPKGIKCSCNPLSFKLSKTDKSVNVIRDETGEIKLDCHDHTVSLSFNRITTPPCEDEHKKYEMISDVMNTPRNKSQPDIDSMD